MENPTVYLLPHEKLNVVILAKELYELYDGELEIHIICKTLHPVLPRTVKLLYHIDSISCNEKNVLHDFDVGNFFEIYGCPIILCDDNNENETIFSPDYKKIEYGEIDNDLIAKIICVLKNDEFYTYVKTSEFDSKKIYSPNQVFWNINLREDPSSKESHDE